ncbi:DUF4082 domain-containing protein [Lentzea sp. BCCO 10_0798]|uniref:DUF4082 domain-containing protein n=1 Tax=Lentzea kristufekii TaxID=3095430 RepID=A0ABU4TVX2_9PSEU|nr:DUF4082 domain-containing protein [Lentzea sp. BCCO 10_0798]MDX8052463.1 DUF4082 domain-containing protein [Lentzea sp. BCCO 10_0798]
MRRIAVLLLALVLVSPTPALAADNPVAMIFSPTAEVSVPVNQPLLVIGGAVNGESGGITGVDFSTDHGTNWTPADTRGERWTVLLFPSVSGPMTIHARARTASTTGPTTVSRTIHVGGTTVPALAHETSLFLHDTHNPTINDPDEQAVEIGMRVAVDRPGSITALIIRRGDYTGPVTARVWSNGTLLAEQEAPGAAHSQRITFGTPVPVVAGTEYVVSYYTPAGGYKATENYFVGNLAQTPFKIPVNAGVHSYSGGFPADTWFGSNYGIEPVFRP